MIDPKTKFLVALSLGRRDEALIHDLLQAARDRVTEPQNLVLFTDGEASYRTLFLRVFGVPYRPPRKHLHTFTAVRPPCVTACPARSRIFRLSSTERLTA